MDAEKRAKMVAVAAAQMDAGAEVAYLPLGLYFDGNDEEQSIAGNRYDGTPLSEFRRVLFELLARPDVHDVRVMVDELPDVDDPSESDIWGFCSNVWVHTTLSSGELEKLVESLNCDAIVEGLTENEDRPDFLPQVAGMSDLFLWWD